MKKFMLLPILLLFVYAPVVHAQSLDIPIKGYGISFGNSKNFTGLRFNIVDKEVEQINGLNLAFGSVGEHAEMNGIALGALVGGEGSSLNGIALGVAASFKKIRGISIGGWYGNFSTESLIGIQMGFLGSVVSKGTGVSVGGLLNVSKDEFNGIAIGGLVNYAKEMNGLQIGLFNRAEELNGIQIGLINYAGNNSPGLQWLPLINAHFSF